MEAYRTQYELLEAKPFLPETLSSTPFDDQRGQKRRRIRRVCHFFVATLALCLTVHLFAKNVIPYFRKHCITAWSESDWRHPDGGNLPDGVDIEKCASWSDPQPLDHHHDHAKFFSSASFELPVDSEKLIFLSKGPSVGAVRFFQTDDKGSKINVTAKLKFRKHRALDIAKLCLLSGSDGQDGIGIFSDPDHHRRRRNKNMYFEVTVQLPQAVDSDILHLNELQTNMPFFVHKLEDLSKVEFQSISLHSAFLPIHARNLLAESATIESALGPVEGNFNVSKSLVIRTTNSPIRVNASLFSNKDAEEVTKLLMVNSNAPIDSKINLISTSDSAEGGSFQVTAETSISPVTVSVDESPVSSSLVLHASTSIGPAVVHIHPAYEGRFEASSTHATKVEVDEKLEDPANRGRTRTVQFDSIGHRTRGSVEWEGGGQERGEVKVTTSIGPATLYL